MVVKAELYLPVTKRSSLLYRSVSDLENFLKNGFIEKEIKWELFFQFFVIKIKQLDRRTNKGQAREV
jgi:hypothetical protein